ncbi:hypothetical protein L1049_018959 [Liquidambar formosana]|uniref:Uncharacterized protein n=1 Tax=Liquidambar formosana TaxID=63359 RepID=A0AAP0RBT3_LIQFO
MENDGKLPESDITGALHGLLGISDDEGDELSPELSFKEEMVEEVMQELWKEISSSTSTDPTSPPANFPPPSTPSMMSPSFFGKNESCGPSFSDSASTVMAGIVMGGGGGGGGGMYSLVGPIGKVAGGEVESPATGSGWWVSENGVYGLGVGEGFGERMDGCDGGELDDEWLARVLKWGPHEVDERT